MRRRRTFNPKRSIREAAQTNATELEALAARARYNGNPEHKRNPGDFGLTPPARWRPGKGRCDDTGIVTRAAALSLLREGIRRGLLSEQVRGEWPQNVWTVTRDQVPLEAQLEGNGVYHGYPMSRTDPFREEVFKRWPG